MRPYCECGEWTGVATRIRSHAERAYRQHVAVAHAVELRDRGARTPAVHRREPTPVDALPAELRPS